jgi:predicted XRE-type DNA-binding protein
MAESVFYDIADTPEEAANLSARSLLMIAIGQQIKRNGWTQAEAARVLGVQQPRVSDLVNGKISKFSLDALVNMLPAVGLTVAVEPSPVKPAAHRMVGPELPRRVRTRPRVAANTSAGAILVGGKKKKSAVTQASAKGKLQARKKV